MLKTLAAITSAALAPLAAAFSVPNPEPKPATPTAVDPATHIPAEAFAALPAFEEPSLSPDGMRLAAKMAIAGRQ